jgi:hypothetical protein
MPYAPKVEATGNNKKNIRRHKNFKSQKQRAL